MAQRSATQPTDFRALRRVDALFLTALKYELLLGDKCKEEGRAVLLMRFNRLPETASFFEKTECCVSDYSGTRYQTNMVEQKRLSATRVIRGWFDQKGTHT